MDYKKIFFNIADYTLIKDKKLGKGAFGTVYICENNKTHKLYAAKIIDTDEKFDGDDQILIMRESSIISSLDHPSILKFYGINFRSFDNANILQPTLITDYIPNGSLRNILNKSKKDEKWTPTKRYICLLGISNAMNFIHSQHFLHRDLKPENILLDKDYAPIISDFGLARCFPKFFSSSTKMTLTGHVGTPLYMAPEIIEDDKYGPEVDVYAFSILAYEIITGQTPYFEIIGKLTPYKFCNKVLQGMRPTFTKNMTEKMKKLISKCWSNDIKERPTFNTIFNELASDFSYFQEKLNRAEINEYIKKIQKTQIQKKIAYEKVDPITDNCLSILKDQLLNGNAQEIFFFACESGNCKIVEYLLSIKSIDINAKKTLKTVS